MLLLGSRAPGRHVEQHDFFFGIAAQLKDLIPEIKKFWPEAGNNIHVDAWREVNAVDGYQVRVVPKEHESGSGKKLFFINLGGYQENKFEEQHYTVLTVKEDRAAAFREASKHGSLSTRISKVPILISMINMELMSMIYTR